MYNRGEIMTEEERVTLYNWIMNDLWSKLQPQICNRLHYDLRIKNDPNVIPLVWEIHNRIIKREGMEGYLQEPSLRHFIAVIPKGAWIQKHTDRNIKNLFHTRFNVFISSPKNSCKTYYDGNVVETKDATYAVCRSGMDEHYTDVNEEDIPRVAISFGYIIPLEKLDELTADKTIGTYKYYPLSMTKKMYNRGEIMNENEQNLLREWINNTMMTKVNRIDHKRFDITMDPMNQDILPLVWDIKDRIIKKEGLELYKDDKLARDFLGIVPTGGNIPKHKDENYKDYIHSRFNVFIQVPFNDCVTYYGLNIVDAKERSYVFSRSGVDEHWTTVNTSEVARLSLSFGFMLPKKKVDALTSDTSIGTYSIYPLYKPFTTWDIGHAQPALLDVSGSFYGSILDAGSGLGDNAIWLSSLDRVNTVTGIDIMRESVNESNSRIEKANLTKNVQCIMADILGTMPFEESTFDCLLDSALFHNFRTTEIQSLYISKVTPFIKLGGIAVVIFFSDKNLDPWKGPMRINKDEGINRWISGGWEIKDVKETRYITNWPEGGGDAVLFVATRIR
jgi:hypothetical protein